MPAARSSDAIAWAGSHRLVIFALLAAIVTAGIAAFYPSGKPADELMSLGFGATYGWIMAQALFLIVPGILLGMVASGWLPRIGTTAGAAWIAAVPLVMLCDALTFNWIAERFLSATLVRITTTLLPGLILHVTLAMVVQATVISILSMGVLAAGWKLSGMVGRRWREKEESVSPPAALGVLISLAVLLSLPALRSLSSTVGEMENISARHPFCAFHLVGFRGVGVPQPQNEEAVLSRLRGLQAAEAVHRRELLEAAIEVDRESFAKSRPESLPDVLLVVVECLRPDLLNPEVMPHLHEFAQRSIYCPNNFSSGNATCFGMFGMVTGLESNWFHRPVNTRPLLNRALRQVGYEVGFYGGHTGWWQYDMDGFVRPELFDDFQIEEPELPDSDLRTVDRALSFIGRRNGQRGLDSPRMAIAYMFATHSRYSDPEDQIFQPAAPVNSFLTRTPETIEEFFNRFKNSMRTMDKLLKPLLRDDCVVIVVGDHGEPFFEDGTAFHGTRLSRYQNMTPAIIHYPGVTPQIIETPTFHSDLLPTLFSILHIPLTDDEPLDGVDLLTTPPQALQQRSFMTGNYLDKTSLLVGPWTFDPDRPFGYRVVFDIHDWQSNYLNPVDDLGYQWSGDEQQGAEYFREWIVDRFGEDAFEDSTSEPELFARFFASQDPRIRLAALKIASQVSDPEDALYRLISDATRDRDTEVRDYAKQLVIEVNRRRGRAE